MTFTGPNAIPDPPTPKPQSLNDLTNEYAAKQESFTAGQVVDAVEATRAGRHLSTQTEFPWRTSIRSGIATLLLVLSAAAAVTAYPPVGVFVARYFPDALPTVLGVGVFCGALATLVKRIGSIPAVAKLFVRLGLGVVPKSALKKANPSP